MQRKIKKGKGPIRLQKRLAMGEKVDLKSAKPKGYKSGGMVKKGSKSKKGC